MGDWHLGGEQGQARSRLRDLTPLALEPSKDMGMTLLQPNHLGLWQSLREPLEELEEE